MRRMLRIEEPSAAAAPRGFALFDLGFRPFYLLAALFGAAAVVAWVASIEGRIAPPGVQPGLSWHAHEMVLGFALAVIAGFLLTAGRVWTGLATPTGLPLALLALHWLAARIAMLTGPAWLAALVDGAFPFVLAAAIARVIVGSRNRRNYFVIALLAALGAANAAFHAGYGLAAVRAALWLVMTLVIVMAGRVVPSFTANALPRAGVRLDPKLDRAAMAATLAAFACDLAGWGGWILAAPALAAAALHAWRQAGWAPLATRGRPILWILHLSHAWIPVGFALLALGALGAVPAKAAIHAFSAGAIGGLIMGMITRTALGHTARPLAAGRAETASYVLVHAAALLRLVAALAPGAVYVPLLGASGLCWAAAFLLYFAVYLPRLWSPRLDGKPG
jgi:uncharacterized protein involved in response to NO